MFLDASVIVAIIAREPGWEEILKRLDLADRGLLFSPITRFEAVLGIARKYQSPEKPKSRQMVAAANAAVDEFLSAAGAKEIAVTPEIGLMAVEAASTYGKAVGHPADLNFGDCFSYACAKALKVTLAYKGDDFALTDLG